MKTKLIFTSLLLLATVSLFAQEEGSKRYGFKSATVKYNTSVMGQNVESHSSLDSLPV